VPAAGTETPLPLGERVPDFDLPGTDGARHRLGDASPANATVVVFTCNHCPYALAWHDRILAVADDYAAQGVRFLAVNPNDASRYPADSFEAMQRRVREKPWPMPYLHDESQGVARAWGAAVTPELYVLDADLQLRYHGAPDADHGDPRLRAAWLRTALDEVLAGRPVSHPATRLLGCSVKWRPER